MPPFVKFILGAEGLAILACLVIVIYLIFRRLRIKEKEDFEKRDN